MSFTYKKKVISPEELRETYPLSEKDKLAKNKDRKSVV